MNTRTNATPASVAVQAARNERLRHRAHNFGLTGPSPSGAFLFSLDRLLSAETDALRARVRNLESCIQAAADHLKRGDEYDRDVADSLMEVLNDAA